MAEIGRVYKVKLKPEHLLNKVSKASDDLIIKYPKYADLNNKQVMVLAKGHGTNVKVGIVDKGRPLEKFWFTISSNWLVPLDKKCDCSTRILMCRGCMCGAFKAEQEL